MDIKQVVVFSLASVIFAGCSTMDMGKGGSVASGAAGNSGAQGESNQLAKCAAPIATVEIDEPSSEPGVAQYAMLAAQMGLPSDPRPLMKLIIAQTGCFKVVDRGVGLRAAKREHELAEAGFTRKGSTVKKGNVVEAQYTLQPQIIFSNNNAGGGAAIGAIAGMFIPGAGLIAGMMKFKEAQVMITLINNDTLVQEGVAEGSAKSTDIGIGGALLGGFGGAGGAGWSNTDEGKVVAAALMDATNKIVPLVQNLQVPQAPAPQPQAAPAPSSAPSADNVAPNPVKKVKAAPKKPTPKPTM